MEDSIRNFASQFNFEPTLENPENFRPGRQFVVGGMGGSNLATDLLTAVWPELIVRAHRDYGLPSLPPETKKQTSFIACSFSGETQETIDFFRTAAAQGLKPAAVSKGGALLTLAEKEKMTYLKLPETSIQPRMALGFLLNGLAKLLKPEILPELHRLAYSLNVLHLEEQGRQLAEQILGRAPLIYSSNRNRAAARLWKIKLNESGKTPAFFNSFPELNHNEMTGFDYNQKNADLSKIFAFIFLKDSDDPPPIQKRMAATARLLRQKELKVSEVELDGASRLERIINAGLLADWTALFLARGYGADPEAVPLVEQFKKMLAE